MTAMILVANATNAASLTGLGGTLLSKGDYGGAERAYREACEIDRKALGPAHPNTLANADSVADALTMQGKTAEAEAIYRQNLEQERRSLGSDHPDVATTLVRRRCARGGSGHEAIDHRRLKRCWQSS